MKAKHRNTIEDYDKPYEPNDIGLKGIMYFGVALLILIIVTFALMWALLLVMRDQALESKETAGPMVMSEQERLPPEPRLQLAPGFGVDATNGRVNMELHAPQSEYRELQRQWAEMWSKGLVDPKTGASITMPIETAKERLLQQPIKARSGTDAENALNQSRLVVSDSSAGRLASEKRR